MKMEFNAKIVAYELFMPDPEEPKRMGIRVKLQAASIKSLLGKPTKAVLPIDFDDREQFPLNGYVRISVVDTQQEMAFAPPRAKPGAAQLGIVENAGEGDQPRRGRKPAESEPLH
jgi:hypothetical protein